MSNCPIGATNPYACYECFRVFKAGDAPCEKSCIPICRTKEALEKMEDVI